MTCERAHDSAHRYVAGNLSGDQLEAYEVHLLTCEECRQVVRLGASARPGLRTPIAMTNGRGRTLGLGVLLAAAIVLAVQLRQDAPSQELTRFTAPRFEGGAARSDADSVTAAVDRGMASYTARDYRTAARDLAWAARYDSTPSVAFYLGVARLMSRDERGSLSAFVRAQQPPGNPYEAEARVLAAKAWLRLGEPDSALTSLGAFVSDDAVTAARVNALEDSIRRSRR